MSTKQRKQKENINSSSDFLFEDMPEMMNPMKNMCCTGKDEYPDCFTMMKNKMNQMKDKSRSTAKETEKESQEGLK